MSPHPDPGQLIDLRRRDLGMSVRGLARAAGMDASDVAKIIKGKTYVGAARLTRICRALEVSL